MKAIGNPGPEIEDVLASVKARMEQAAEEAIRDIYARFPFGHKVRLFTGKEAILEPFFPPKQDEDGKWKFGVDLNYVDGSGHLEYTFKQTGWGGAP